LKALVLNTAKRLGLFEVASWMTRSKIRILGYHGIWYRDGHFGNHLFMSPEKFQARMSWLKQSKYRVMPLSQALDGLKAPDRQPYSTVITIDDGWYGTYKYMLPSIEKENLSATLYVYTEAVDSQAALTNILIPALINLSEETCLRFTRPDTSEAEELNIGTAAEKEQAVSKFLDTLTELTPDQEIALGRNVAVGLGFDYDEIMRSRQFGFMTYDEITDADRRGLDIQLHTHTHHLDAETPEQIADELRANRERLAPHVSSTLDHFCYPSGVNCPGMHAHLEEQGVKSATLIDTGLVGPKSHKFELARILDGEEIDQLEFEAEMSGFLELLRIAKRMVARH
jgi:peptidoglycan/xylan/chitin deacetylase (PgdA/CDA1 family)